MTEDERIAQQAMEDLEHKLLYNMNKEELEREIEGEGIAAQIEKYKDCEYKSLTKELLDEFIEDLSNKENKIDNLFRRLTPEEANRMLLLCWNELSTVQQGKVYRQFVNNERV